MLIPLSWLKEFVDIPISTEQLAERLTLAGMEVDAIQKVGDWWDPETIVVGEVAAVLPHPDADRLVLIDVDYGAAKTERVVTGAPNLFQYKGQSRADGSLPVLKAPFAREGSVLLDAYTDERPRPFKKLKASKIRGVRSAGMVCSERELGLSDEHEGILLLPTDAPTGMPLRTYLGEDVLSLDLTPDMARCLNIMGVAREVAALTGGALHLPTADVQTSGDDTAAAYFDVRIDDPDLCHRYTGILIRDVQIGPSPKWMQDRLNRAGMRPINNVVDITNYIMLEYGQPLHAFDYDILVERAKRVGEDKPTIIVRRAAPNSKFTTLDEVERQMDDTMLMIADTAGDIAIAGVMGGLESEVSDATHNILLESATFEGINNRRTAQKLRMSSEASYRFARGIPATLNPLAAQAAAELMRQYAGGSIVPGLVDAYPVPQELPTVYTTASDMQRLLGLEITLEQAANALRQLDFAVEQVDAVADDAEADATFALHREPGEALLACTSPWHRLDIRYPADLTEEVARMIGYDRINTTLIDDVLPTQRRNRVLETEESIRNILVGIGLQETVNYPLTSRENHGKLRDATMSADAPYVELANPLTPERSTLRRSLVLSTLENLGRNLRFVDRLATFEVGRIYLPERGDGVLPFEERHVAIGLVGPRQIASFYNSADADHAPAAEMDFFDLKGVVETLLHALGFKDEDVEFTAHPDTNTFGPRCAEITLKGEPLGIMGEIHPTVRASFDIPALRTCIADLRIAPLVQPDWSVEPMAPISTYPPVVEDLAFEVTEEVTARRLEKAIRDAGGDLLVAVELFDIYRGDPIPVGSKSMAYRLTYQSTDRSLSEKEVTKLRQRIIRTVENVVSAKLRG